MTINHIKRSQSKKMEACEYDDGLNTSKAGNEVDQTVNKEYYENIIQNLLEALNPEQRACIVLRNIEGLSYDQIAQTLNININTVRSRLKRAREKMLSLRKEVIQNEM